MSSVMSKVRLSFAGMSIVALMASGVAASPAMAGNHHKKAHKSGKSVSQSANGGNASANGGNGGNGGTTICPNNKADNGSSSKALIGAAAGCAFNGNGGNGGWGGYAEGGDGGQNANVSSSN